MSPLGPAVREPEQADSPIVFNQVGKDYRTWRHKYLALDDVSFELRQGRTLGLLGPNGAGKTTLIKLILGLLRPSRGSMQIFGSAMAGITEKERIGFLPEESYLYGFLSVLETLKFSASLYQNKQEALARVESTLEMVGMAEFRHKKISECSKGMARRAALAQSIVHDPDLVLLDEPTSGFDPVGINDVKVFISELKKRGKTVLICSHQLGEIEEVCDDIVVLRAGRVIAQGELEQLLEKEGHSFLKISEEDRAAIVSWIETQGFSYETRSAGRLTEYFIKLMKS